MAPVVYTHDDHYCAACHGSQDLSAFGIRKKRVACKYYQSGNCRRGSSCPFAHVYITAPVEPPTIPHPAYTGERMYTYYPLRQAPVYRPLGSQAHPVFLWPPYAPLSPSFDPGYARVSQADCLPDYPDDKSDPSSAESSSTAASVDYQCRMSPDTPWFEGAEFGTVRGVATPSADLGTNLSPGHIAYSYPGFPAIKAECIVGRDRATSGENLDQGSMVALPSPFLLPWQGDPKKRPLAYKTKPCKFFATNGKCTSGEKCTFIHNLEFKGNPKKTPPGLVPPNDAKLPPKPLNKYDDCRARDFYPITWRVIGGGVMMGGQRQICSAFAAGQCKYGSDCKLAHETELETDEVGFIEPKNEPIGEKEASPRTPAKGTPLKRVRSSSQRKPTKVPPTESRQQEIFPSTTPRPQKPDVPAAEEKRGARKKGDEVTGSSAPPSHRRTQSMSKVVTSPSSLDTVHPSYAAEL